MEYKKEISYQLERYPKNCMECPCFSTIKYQCMNESGVEGCCELGYMKGNDMRDFRGRTKFSGCKMETDERVTLF